MGNLNCLPQAAEPRSIPAMSKSPGGQRPELPSEKKGGSKYSCIPDTFTSVEQVTGALREAGLESSNLILGIDFTKSNEWTGRKSFNNRSLHSIGAIPNPYEKAIGIIGKALAPFDEDNLIPCFGFGDSSTHDDGVFSFNSDHRPCQGFEEVLACYREIVPKLKLSGPTSFGPIIEAAMDIVEESGGQYHVLVIIADGQVTRSSDTKEGKLSQQERATVNAIVSASSYALSIVLVGVGDGPWEEMQKFDDKVPRRNFDNFQFVNFTSIMDMNVSSSKKEAAFAVAALMEIPFQYKATVDFHILGKATGKAKKIVPLPPPIPSTQLRELSRAGSSSLESPGNGSSQVCAICWSKPKDMAFGCGHMMCRVCGNLLSTCPICRKPITNRLRLYTG
ncbi:hypothetical protein H6P81_019473 [Aristolochia fimbriata]|uniref:RING-type domain-containing protein n=1 Tax=Aristolochia fimbriata TaxID=158543 RepID=A0AAV7DWG5_ARIFI|nr:hypothetical protein H6P81_019473 [Aristolochia fimbriata]